MKNELPIIQADTIGYSKLDSFYSNNGNPNWTINTELLNNLNEINIEENIVMSKRRLVKIMIVDPNESVPLKNAILVNENEKITDLEDNELFFELDIKAILAEHNNYRITLIDKQASKNKSQDVMLEPVKIRDLKLVIITVAEF